MRTVLLLALASGCVTPTPASSALARRARRLNVALPAPASLDMFGFAAIDCGWDDPHDAEPKVEYSDEVAGFTNVAHACVWGPGFPLEARLQHLSDAGLRALLHVETLFFDHVPDPDTGSGVRLVVRPDAAARWDRFLELNAHVLTPDTVAALYLVDEPVWNGLSAAHLDKLARVVERDLPALPSFVVEAYPVLDQLVIPRSVDWVAFDRYDSTDPYNDPVWRADLETLRAARSRPDQAIVIVADTQWRPFYSDHGVEPADMADVIASYGLLAVDDPDVIGMVGYLWPGGLDEPDQLGARSLPANVEQVFHDLGSLLPGT